MVAPNEVLLDSVENVKPHGGTKELGAPLDLGVHVRLAHGRMANVLGNVVGGHSGVLSLKLGSFFYRTRGWWSLCLCAGREPTVDLQEHHHLRG